MLVAQRNPRVIAARCALLLACALLFGGCTVKTTVELTATTPANVTHLYVTVKEIWFSSNADNTATDGNWTKKKLSDPVTVDLAALNGGAVTSIGSVTLISSTYKQVRLVLVDADADLATSASDLGLSWNSAVQYVDDEGVSRLVRLELASPSSALLIPASIKVSGASALTALSGDSSSDSTDSTTTVVVDIDALRGLHVFDYGGLPGALLNPGVKAYHDPDVGTIKGTLDLSAISSTDIDGDQGIVVSAEALDPDGKRYSIVKSVRVDSDGAFTLYPLPVDPDTDVGTYDIVVHGPGVETMLVTDVTVDAGETTTLQDSAITVAASTSFVVNTSSSVAGGTVAEFYQTLAGRSVPNLVEWAAVNPISGGFATDLALGSERIVYGAYNDGYVIGFSSAAPVEGAAAYQLAPNSRWRAIGSFNAISGATAGSTVTQSIALAAPALPDGAFAGTISGTIGLGTANAYDQLYLTVSRGGQIVDVVNLSGQLSGSTSVTFAVDNIPAGISSAVYDVAVRAWNSASASSSLVRAAFDTAADLRQVSATGLSLQL